MVGRTFWLGGLVLAAVLVSASPAGAMKVLIADDVFSSDADTSLDFLIDVLAEHDVTYMANTDDQGIPTLTNNLDYLLNFDAVIFYKAGIDNEGRLLTEAEYDALLTYVEAGGNLIVTGPHILGSPNDVLMADLVGSATLGDGVASDYYITADADSFILTGPFGDFADMELDLAGLTNHDKLFADENLGAAPVAFIGGADYDKVIFTAFAVPGGSIGAWTGNNFGDDWYPDLADGQSGARILNNWLVDDDNDAVLDGIDNCPETPNFDQEDADGDGWGDACDSCDGDPDKIEPGECGCGEDETDSDADGVPNCVDNCPADANGNQRDSDGDGIGDACDLDPDKPVTVICGLGASQALLPIALGLGLMKVGLVRIRRRLA